MIRLAAFVACGCLFAAGCSDGDIPRERPIPVQGDIFLQVRSVLEGYSSGQPVGSELQLFDGWIAEVQAKDPAAAELLAAGLREVAEAPRRAKAVATRLLSKFPAGVSREQPAKNRPGQADDTGNTINSSGSTWLDDTIFSSRPRETHRT
jgi:hypothetical protein